jgi:hypothetical protein
MKSTVVYGCPEEYVSKEAFDEAHSAEQAGSGVGSH